MTHALKTVSVAIGDLTAHPANVRANSPETYDSESIANLKASILALGLLQPLLVQKIDGKYGVLAGGRRHASLAELVADNEIKEYTAETKIDCREVPADCDVTTALSLAENITQAPMNPIDEFEAFARMMEVDRQTPETIAKTFGTTVAAVKGRLRYGLVHPDIRAAVRAKTITIDVMKAFADHPSQAVQKEVFDAIMAADNYVQAYTVRNALKSRGVQVSDDIGQFVRDEYEARGGVIAKDLLEEHSVLEDSAMVETIMLEKLTAAAETARAEMGFAWSSAMLRNDYNAMAHYGRVYPGPVEPDEAGQKRLEAIQQEMDELSLQMQDENIDDDTYAELSDKMDALDAEATALQEGYAEKDLARAGVIASWGHGSVMLHVGMVRPEDMPEEKKPATKGADGAGEADDHIVYAASLQDDLKVERAMALGAALAQNPAAALDLTLFKLVSDIFARMNSTYAIKVNAQQEYRSHAKLDEIDQTSTEQMEAAHDALDLSWRDDDRSPAEQFKLFRALAPDEKAKLVAYATATTTQPCLARERNRDCLMHDLEIEIMPDIRAHWTPNAALFNRFKKAWLLKILSEDLGLSQEAVTLASSSKKEIVAFCDKLFAEPFATLSDAQREAVESWCPPMMQTTGVFVPEVVASKATSKSTSGKKKAA